MIRLSFILLIKQRALSYAMAGVPGNSTVDRVFNPFCEGLHSSIREKNISSFIINNSTVGVE